MAWAHMTAGWLGGAMRVAPCGLVLQMHALHGGALFYKRSSGGCAAGARPYDVRDSITHTIIVTLWHSQIVAESHTQRFGVSAFRNSGTRELAKPSGPSAPSGPPRNNKTKSKAPIHTFDLRPPSQTDRVTDSNTEHDKQLTIDPLNH